MEGFVEDWKTRGVDAWNEVPNRWRPDSGERVGWWALPEYLGDAFIAPLLGAPAGSCIMQPHVHHTVSYLLSCPEPFARGHEVVLTENEFPSVLHSVQQWAGLREITPRIVPANADGFVDRDAVLEAIGPETALVVLSHVGFTTGERLDHDYLYAVAACAHAHDALFAIDGYHAASTMPVTVPETDCDVYFGGLLKEGSGSTGNAYLYVRPELGLTPRLAGWFADADPFGFNQTPQPHPAVRRRFLGGTTAVASLYHGVEGVRLLLDAGLEAVRAHSLALTERCIARADAAGLALRSPRAAEQRGAMVILEAERADLLCAWLKAQGVYTDSRQQRFLRLAPWVWNTAEEVERAFDVIGDGLRSGVYLRFDAPVETGPVT
jgi:kynureninase